MLFKHQEKLEDLRQTGRRATAEILSMKTLGHESTTRGIATPDEDLSTSWSDCWMQLRVTPEDSSDPPFEATALTRIHTFKWKGSTVPVWYDPLDHTKVVVDYEDDLAHHDDTRKVAEDKLIHRYDQRLGLAWTPIAGDLFPIAAMVQDGTGTLSVRGLGVAMREPAAVAVSCVRAHSAALAPQLEPDWWARHDLHIDQPYTPVPASVDAAEAASAGLAIASAVVSLIGGHIVRTDVAVTGQLTPDGDVLAVPALKDKAHVAKRNWAARLVAPAANEHELMTLDGLELVFIARVDMIVKAALARRAYKGAPG